MTPGRLITGFIFTVDARARKGEFIIRRNGRQSNAAKFDLDA